MWRPHLLIVEDDPAVAQLVSRVADHAGYETRICESIHSERACIDFKPDLIVLDIFMPDLDGFEVMNYIAQHHLEVSIIILSSKPASFRHMAERMGEELGLSIVGSLAKPFSVRHLHSMLEHIKQSSMNHMQYSLARKKWAVKR